MQAIHNNAGEREKRVCEYSLSLSATRCGYTNYRPKSSTNRAWIVKPSEACDSA